MFSKLNVILVAASIWSLVSVNGQQRHGDRRAQMTIRRSLSIFDEEVREKFERFLYACFDLETAANSLVVVCFSDGNFLGPDFEIRVAIHPNEGACSPYPRCS